MGDDMAVKRFSHAAAKALRLLGENTRVAARQAYEIMVHELGDPEGNPIARNWSVYSRVLSELWRNGWVGIDAHAQNKAVTAAEKGLGLDGEDYYTHWLLAYAHKTRARFADHYRSTWATEIERAFEHYGHARDRLLAEQRSDPSEAVAGDLNAVTFDWAETFIYVGEPARAIKEMESIVRSANRAKPQDWEDWAYAFALHQGQRYGEAVGICQNLLTAENANNDIRVLLAAGEARSRQGRASATATDFHLAREGRSLGAEDREPVWTVALEIERGAFPPDLPSAGERHWAESLELAKFDESAGAAQPRVQNSFLYPSEPMLMTDRRGAGASAAPKGKSARKRPARKKKAAKKRPAKKAAKRKPSRRQSPRRSAKRRGARKSAKRKS